MLAEFKRVKEMPDQEIKKQLPENKDSASEIRLRHLQLLLYHYNLLCRLRDDEAEAWDEVNELYEDD